MFTIQKEATQRELAIHNKQINKLKRKTNSLFEKMVFHKYGYAKPNKTIQRIHHKLALYVIQKQMKNIERNFDIRVDSRVQKIHRLHYLSRQESFHQNILETL